jgi:hypothetical protein
MGEGEKAQEIVENLIEKKIGKDLKELKGKVDAWKQKSSDNTGVKRLMDNVS